VSPFLVVVGAYVLIAVLVAIGVVGLSPGAFRPLVRAPRHLWQLVVYRRMRQNHALEHATINVLMKRYRTHSVTGMPDRNGFHVRGRIAPAAVAEASREALRRLRRGERALAFSSRCPTSLVAAQIVIAILGTIALYFLNQLTPPLVLLVLVGSALAGPFLSPYLQRLILVSPEIGDLTIRDIEVDQPHGRFGVVSFLLLNPVFVRTGITTRSGRSEDGDVILITRDQQEIPAGRFRVRE
jgi:hypothetical protein